MIRDLVSGYYPVDTGQRIRISSKLLYDNFPPNNSVLSYYDSGSDYVSNITVEFGNYLNTINKYFLPSFLISKTKKYIIIPKNGIQDFIHNTYQTKSHDHFYINTKTNNDKGDTKIIAGNVDREIVSKDSLEVAYSLWNLINKYSNNICTVYEYQPHNIGLINQEYTISYEDFVERYTDTLKQLLLGYDTSMIYSIIYKNKKYTINILSGNFNNTIFAQDGLDEMDLVNLLRFAMEHSDDLLFIILDYDN